MGIHRYGQQLKAYLELVSPQGGQDPRRPRIDSDLTHQAGGEAGVEAGG
jgi:hypothetical protein